MNNRLTLEQRKKVIRMLKVKVMKRKYTYDFIAKKFGVTRQAIMAIYQKHVLPLDKGK